MSLSSPRKLIFPGLAAVALGLGLGPTWLACERYEPPPRVDLAGLTGGVLPDSRAPLVVDFGMPVVPETVRVKVAFADTDIEGNLADQDDDPDTELRVLLQRDPDEGDKGGRAELEADNTRLVFYPDASLPVGPKLVLIAEPGLAATNGNALRRRVVLPFSFTVKCDGGVRADNFKSGTYFALLEVEQPLGTQIQILASIEVDPATGAFAGQFTNADRNPDNARCPTPCKSTDACRLLPAPECVPPSTRAGSVDEHPDFVPNATPPIGYTFSVRGCAVDGSPPVTVEGLTMTAQFAPEANGGFRATGSLTADAVLLGGNRIGPGKGTMSALFIPVEQVPPGVPPAPPLETGDAGADAAP